MDTEIIRSYLVGLGFKVDQPELQKFNDTLRTVAKRVEEVTMGTYGIAAFFVKTGAVVTGVLATIATGTVAMMNHVAESDLQFQIFARRMFMSADAAKALKIATDALGYSLEDIIWGPKELQQRFAALMGDEKRMSGMLPSDFELQMRHIRDIRFEFTRLGVAAQFFAMQLVSSLSKKLFGSEDDLLDWLRAFVEWFIMRSPELANSLATKLVPVLQNVWRIIKDIASIISILTPNLNTVGNAMDKIANAMGKIADVSKGAVEGLKGWSDRHPIVGDTLGFLKNQLTMPQAQHDIEAMARKMGLDPAVALAIAGKESNFNQGAIGSKGELGLFQLMPGTAAGLGVNAGDAQQNMRGGISYLMQLYKKYKDWYKAFEAYNGGEGNVDRGTVSSAARSYATDAMKETARWRYSLGQDSWHGSLDPIAYSGNGVNMGGVTVNIMQPNATPEQVHKAVTKAIDDKLGRQTQRHIAQLGGSFA